MKIFCFDKNKNKKRSVENLPLDPAGFWENCLDEIPIAVAIINRQGIIRKHNREFLNFVNTDGKPRSNFLDFLDERSREILSGPEYLEKKGSDSASFKTISIKFVGKQDKSASLYLGKIKDGDDYLIFLVDTTEQKNLETRFVQSQKMQAVGQLAGGVAHDFNNLLTAMIGFCDLLLMRHQPGDQSFADIMQIKQNANRAAGLVRQLLAFSRQQTMQPRVLDITETIAELSNLIRRLIGENIKLKIHHGQGLWQVMADQGQLEQVVINLAVNARDAMQNGGVLTVETGNITIAEDGKMKAGMISSSQDEAIKAGDYVMIKISDTGYGIPPNLMQKIFEPFFTTKKVGEGTGLGLSTVYGIIKQTGGYIYVASEEGKGTNFTIFLRRYIANGEIKAASDDKKEIVQDLTGKGTILIVEDEDPVRIFSSRALQNKGYKVLEADSAEVALDIMKEQGKKIDMIVTDVVMPGITGPEMVKKMEIEYPGIKVIYVSGYAEDVFMKTHGSDRNFNFLPKPYTLQQLAAKVKEVMR